MTSLKDWADALKVAKSIDSNTSNDKRQSSTGPYDDRIQTLIRSALNNHAKAMEYEDKANARYAELKEEELYILRGRAAARNPISQIILDRYNVGDTTSFDSIVDTRAAADPVWNGHIANNKFYTRKANLDNQMTRTLQAERDWNAG